MIHNVNAVIVLLSVLAIFSAYILGKTHGDSAGYQRGCIDGEINARNAARMTRVAETTKAMQSQAAKSPAFPNRRRNS